MSNFKNFRILIIDDNPAIHDDFRKVLSPSEAVLTLEEELFGDTPPAHNADVDFENIEIDSAYQGKEGALKIIEAREQGRPYAMAFVDIRMPPGLDGVQTIAEFWQHDPDIQIVICTAFSDYSWGDIMGKVGQSDRLLILKKPFDNAEVRQLVTTLTCKWNLSDKVRHQMKELEALVTERTTELKNALSISTATLESSMDGIMVVTNENKIINYNLRFMDMWRIPYDLIAEQSLTHLFGYMRDQVGSPKSFCDAEKYLSESAKLSPIEIIRLDGRVYEMLVHPYNLDGVESGHLFCFRDITQRKIFEKELAFEATHDYLTGLPNRLLLVERLKQTLTYAKRHHRFVGIAYIDLDRFKYINDTLGHAIGDGLLQGVAARIRSNIRDIDTLSRLGGDEFVLIIADMAAAEDALPFIKRISESLSSPFYLENHEVRISGSMGISIYPDHGTDPDLLLSQADTALYHVKEEGRGTYKFYTPGMSDSSKKMMEMEAQLKGALEKGEFYLDYQPIIGGDSEKIVGVEALLRWHHPLIGIVSPSDFIPITEKCGIIIPIGEWILNEVRRQQVEWKNQGLPPLYIAVNISGIQLKHPHFLKTFCEIIERLDIDTSLLEFELTESILLEQSNHILASLQRFKEMGIKIVLDDFGTGYSSLTYLRRFPVDKIKIEKAFISNLHAENDSRAIVSAIIAMAHKLNLQVVAEGVEHQSIVDILHTDKCDFYQGYLYSQPVSAEKITQILRDGGVENTSPHQHRNPNTPLHKEIASL